MPTTVSLSQDRISLSAHASRSVLYVTRLVSWLWTKSMRAPTNLIAHRDCMREMRPRLKETVVCIEPLASTQA